MRTHGKLKIEDAKNAFPQTADPTNTHGFIVYMSVLSTKLVDYNRSGKTCMVVFYLFYKCKPLKIPSSFWRNWVGHISCLDLILVP